MSGLTIHWLPLLVALGLLWPPGFLPKSIQRRYRDGNRPSIPTVPGMLTLWPNWVDLARALVAAWLLLPVAMEQSAPPADADGRAPLVNHESPTDPDETPAAKPADSVMPSAITFAPEVKRAGMKAKAICLLVLVVGLVIQSIRVDKEVVLFAPIYYVSGITLALTGLMAGGFVVMVGWLFALALKNASYQLPTMGAALMVAGYLLVDDRLVFLISCAVIFLPLALGFLSQKPLLYMNRRLKSAAKG